MMIFTSTIKKVLNSGPITLSDESISDPGYRTEVTATIVAVTTSYSFVVPEGVTRINYIMVGGGGGGGGAKGLAAGGGGGAGQIVQGHFVVTGGAQVSVQVGKGGTYGCGSTQYYSGDYQPPAGFCGRGSSTPCSSRQVGPNYQGDIYRPRGGSAGGDTVITVTCPYTGGYTIRARGGCGGANGCPGIMPNPTKCPKPIQYVGGGGGHSWFPVYQINLPKGRTRYKLPINVGVVIPNVPYGQQIIPIACLTNYPKLGSPTDLKCVSTNYVSTGTAELICPVRQHYRPLGFYTHNFSGIYSGYILASYCDPTKHGQGSQSWFQNPAPGANPIVKCCPNNYRPRCYNPWRRNTFGSFVQGSYYCCRWGRSTGGGGASPFSHGGPPDNLDWTPPIYAYSCSSIKNGKGVKTFFGVQFDKSKRLGGSSTSYNGFGTICRHRFAVRACTCWDSSCHAGCNYYPGYGNSSYFSRFQGCASCWSRGGPGVPDSMNMGLDCAALVTSANPDYWWCINDPNCCGIRCEGWIGCGKKITCTTDRTPAKFVYNLSGWAAGGNGGAKWSDTNGGLRNYPKPQGPGSGGNGGHVVKNRPAVCNSNIIRNNLSYNGCVGQDGEAVLHFQVKRNTSVAREILEAGASPVTHPCLPSTPPTAGRVTTYSEGEFPPDDDGNVFGTGINMVDPKTTPLKVLAYGAAGSYIGVKTFNPNYIALYGCREGNRQYYFPTVKIATPSTETISASQFYAKCYIRQLGTDQQVTQPPPPYSPTMPEVGKDWIPDYVQASIALYGGGGGGANNPSTNNVASDAGNGGYGGGAGGNVIKTNITLLTAQCYSSYKIEIGVGGRPGLSGGNTIFYCFTCDRSNPKQNYGLRTPNYGKQYPGVGVAFGGAGATGKDGGGAYGGRGYQKSGVPIGFGGGGGGGGAAGYGGNVTDTNPMAGGNGGVGYTIYTYNPNAKQPWTPGFGQPYYTMDDCPQLPCTSLGVWGCFVVGGGGGGGGGEVSGYVYLSGRGGGRPGGSSVKIGSTTYSLYRLYGGLGGGRSYIVRHGPEGYSGLPNTGFGGGGGGLYYYLDMVFIPYPEPDDDWFGIIFGGVFGYLLGGWVYAGIGLVVGAFLQGGNGGPAGRVEPTYRKQLSDGAGTGLGRGGSGGSGGATISYDAAGTDKFSGGIEKTTDGVKYHVFLTSGFLRGNIKLKKAPKQV